MSYVSSGLANVVIYAAGLFIVNGLSFLMLPYYTHHFQPSEFATITLILSVLPLTRYCLPLEICQAAPVFSNDNKDSAPVYISVGFLFAIMINLLFYSTTLLANKFFHFISFSFHELIGIFSLLIIDSLYYYTSNIMRWQIRPYVYNIVIASTAIIEIILAIYFISYREMPIFGVIFAWLIARSIGLILMLRLNKHLYVLTFDMSKLCQMLAFSVPLVLSNLAYNLNRGFDRWIVASVLGLSAVGLYGAGATIGGVIGFVMASISAALSPMIYKDHTREEAPREITKLFYIVVAFCMLIALVFVAYNGEILKLLLAKEYYDNLSGNLIVPVIVLTSIVSGLYVFAPGIQIKRKTKYLILFNLMSLVINVILASLMIHRYGIVGVAISTFVSVLSNTMVYMFVSQKFYALPIRIRDLLLLTIMFFAAFIVEFYLSRMHTAYPWTRLNLIMIFGFVAAFLVYKIIKHLDRSRNVDMIDNQLQLAGE